MEYGNFQQTSALGRATSGFIAAGPNSLDANSPVAQSPLNRLDNSIGITEQAVMRLEVLADQLCGAIPQAVDNQPKAPGMSGGVFGAIHHCADQLGDIAGRAERALNRIQSQLS